jgi:hypothetical protein
MRGGREAEAQTGEHATPVTAMGPLGLEYLGAKDDPRKQHTRGKSLRDLVSRIFR